MQCTYIYNEIMQTTHTKTYNIKRKLRYKLQHSLHTNNTVTVNEYWFVFSIQIYKLIYRYLTSWL